MGIGAILGKLNPVKTKSKLMVAAGIVVLVFTVWAWTKWDAWKILNLEKENQALEIENQSSKKAADDAESVRAIDETAVVGTLKRREDAEDNSNEIQEQVRNDVRQLQQELEKGRQALDKARDELASLEKQRDEYKRSKPDVAKETPIERSESQTPRVVVKTVERSVPAVDSRIAQRIVDGMWDNYCGQVSNDRGCPSPAVTEGGDSSTAAP
jgi:flagellar biosynthesis chaperone FliJ